jgi:ABC-type dipeptide/oligopeptide/nickel transport system permease component
MKIRLNLQHPACHDEHVFLRMCLCFEDHVNPLLRPARERPLTFEHLIHWLPCIPHRMHHSGNRCRTRQTRPPSGGSLFSWLGCLLQSVLAHGINGRNIGIPRPAILACPQWECRLLSYSLKRLLLALAVAITVSAASFMLLRLSGDVALAIAGEGARQADIDIVRKTYGLDRPLLVQYLDWLGRTLGGDFGQSLYFKTSVAGLIAAKLGTTLWLGTMSILFALLLSVPLGILAALKPNSWLDRLALSLAVAGQALPNFFFALLLIMLFSIQLRWLPVSGSETWLHFVMPTIALGYYVTPPIMRLVRAGMIEVLNADYIRTARAKGLSPASVVLKHALRNALVPVVALAAVQLGFLLGGSIVIETIFALDGLGYLAYQSITHKDFPVTQAVLMLLAVSYVVLTLCADLVNAWIDPRLRTERS